MTPLRPLVIDFHRKSGHAAWPNLMFLVSGVAAAIYLVFHSMALFSDLTAYEKLQEDLEHQSRIIDTDSKHAAEEAKRIGNEVKQANRVLAQLSLPWEELFSDVESSPTRPVALLSVEPDSEKQIVTITGEAKSLDEIVEYLRVLQGKKSLRNIYLQSHRIEYTKVGQPVRFVLVASWTLKS